MLAKHSAKEETPSLEKGKAELDLENYSSFSATKLHTGYLSRLYTSHDMEAGLVNLMNQKYEVCIHLTHFESFISIYIYIYSI